MALELNPTTLSPAPASPASVEGAPVEFDILADRQQTIRALADSPEIDALTSTIDVNDLNTIISFGSSAAEEISRASDTVLRSMSASGTDQSGDLMQTLAKIMQQFNIDEIHDASSVFGKLFGGAKKQLDRIVLKYQSMGNEVDKIYVRLKQYEEEIKRSDRDLEKMFQANITCFHKLEKYIVAGDQGCREIQDYLEQVRSRYEQTGGKELTFEIETLSNALRMLQQRTQDLRIAEAVALQSIPMIRMIQFNNMNLVSKINSAFITTLPVFKQALAQAILLKRQRLQSEALSALDERTNAMLLKNARNAADAARSTQADSSIRTDTLETTWRTILSGLDETKKIRENSRTRYRQDQQKLQKIKEEFAATHAAKGS